MNELPVEQRNWLERAWRFERDGWIFVHVEGEAFARGFAHGFLLAQEIDAGIRDNNFQNEWSTGDGPDYFAEAAEMLYAAKLDDELRREIEGIAEGVRRAGYSYDFRDLLAWNATIELTGSWWPIDKGKPLGELRAGEHCNSFIATGDGVTADGGIVLAHNTWDTYIDANSSNVVLDLVPDQGARILMQTRPGYIHSGTDFFLCGSGIIGAETTIAGFTEYDQKKTPEFARIRQAMQYAHSLDAFVEIMWRDNNGGYANSWMLGDLKTGEIAKFEIGLKYYGLQKTKRGSYWGCNVVEDKRIRYQECDGVGYSNLLKNAGRRIRWQRFLAETPDLDVEKGKAILADHFDEYKHYENPGTRTICAHFDRDPGEFAPLQYGPFYPYGTNDGKVTDATLAGEMRFWGVYGHPCRQRFDAAAFLKEHPQYAWTRDHLQDKPGRDWQLFKAGECD
jgi:hypothetical protein